MYKSGIDERNESGIDEESGTDKEPGIDMSPTSIPICR